MSKVRSKKQKKKRLSKFCFGVIILMIILSITFVGLLFLMNLLPNNYMYIITGVVIFLDFLFTIGIISKNKFRVYFFLVAIVYLIVCLVLNIYIGFTYKFLKNVTGSSTAIEKYQIIVLNDSEFNNLGDLTNKDIGLLDIDDDGYEEAVKKVDENVSYNKKLFNDSIDLIDNLLDGSISAILLDSVSNTVLEENDDNYKRNIRVIYEFEVTVNINSILKKRNVTKESFNVFISGIDSYGDVKASSRSDVNILVSINPNKREVLFTHIPRDYYVTLGNYKSKDKLTHAGIHGIDCSVKSVEALLDIDVNYYVKLNFTSLIDIVNAISGIEVDSKYTFTTGIYDDKMKKTYTFTKGKNTLYGDEALAFVRERKAFNNGDVVRGENQMLVLEAIINKCMQPSILGNYTKLLSSLNDALITNMSDDEIASLVKMQLKNNSSWKFNNFSLSGTSSYEHTYAYPRQKLYVMIPDESLEEDKKKINEVLMDNNN